MIKITALPRLLRVQQWYKNLLIFLGIFMAGKIFNLDFLLPAIVGFISLCLASSGGYIINDLADRYNDRMHPEKKHRPIAAGIYSKEQALIIAALCFGFSLITAAFFSWVFFVLIMTLIVLTTAYTFLLKHMAFADIITIATNFVIRTSAGTFLIMNGSEPWIPYSPYILLLPFFGALFLAVGKREADLQLDTRDVNKVYTREITRSILMITTTLVIVSFILWGLFGKAGMIVALPFILFLIFRYFYIVDEHPQMARHPHKMIKDKKMLVAAGLLGLIMFGVLYVI